MAKLLVHALLVSCLMWPPGMCCLAAQYPRAARRGWTEKTNSHHHGVGGRRRTTCNGSSSPQRTELMSGRALYVRGGDDLRALDGQRQPWWKGVNRKPLPAPEALSRCGSEALKAVSASGSVSSRNDHRSRRYQCQDALVMHHRK